MCGPDVGGERSSQYPSETKGSVLPGTDNLPGGKRPFAGAMTVNDGDLTRNVCRFWAQSVPSKVHVRELTLSMKVAASCRRSSSVSDPDGLNEMVLTSGKKMGLPAGTVHVRATAPPKAPARNHTSSYCPRAQLAPDWSRLGFTAAGIESSHCHHLALNSPYVVP